MVTRAPRQVDGDANPEAVGVSSGMPYSDNQNAQKPEFDLANFRPSSIRVGSIQIYSTHLLSLFQSLIREYPSQSLKGSRLVIDRPFNLLAHYYNDLVALRNRGSQESPEAKGKTSARVDFASLAAVAVDERTKADLNILLRVFERVYIKEFSPEEERYATGVASYKHLWFLYKPGSLVYGKVGGKLAGYVFRWSEETIDDRNNRDRKTFNVHCWSLVYDGRRILRTNATFAIRKFQGVKPIFSLPVFPVEFIDVSDGGKTKEKLQELGEKFHSIVRESPAHMKYSGPSWLGAS